MLLPGLDCWLELELELLEELLDEDEEEEDDDELEELLDEEDEDDEDEDELLLLLEDGEPMLLDGWPGMGLSCASCGWP